MGWYIKNPVKMDLANLKTKADKSDEDKMKT